MSVLSYNKNIPEKFIISNKEIQNGQPVFKGTRVPVQTLFWHLEKGISIADFLKDYPSVKKAQVLGVLKMANKIFSSEKLNNIYENID
ncbi:MAG: DUF433 domain-containing protein [Chitinophagales bacterium]